MTRRFRLLCFSFPLETVGAPSLPFLQGRVTMLPALFFVLPSSLHRTSLAARNLQPYITDLGNVPSVPRFPTKVAVGIHLGNKHGEKTQRPSAVGMVKKTLRTSPVFRLLR